MFQTDFGMKFFRSLLVFRFTNSLNKPNGVLSGQASLSFPITLGSWEQDRLSFPRSCGILIAWLLLGSRGRTGSSQGTPL